MLTNFTINTSTKMEAETDRLGGGLLESNVYDFEIKTAYISQAKSEAIALNIEGETADGGFFKEALYFVSGKAKGNKTYFEKNGKEFALPGYSMFASLLKLSGFDTTPEQQLESGLKTKIVDIYDFDLSKKVPTEVPMVMDLVGAKVKLAILNQTVDKNVKDASGKYVPSGDTREQNVLDKVFSRAGFTTTELTAKLEAPEFMEAWLKKNKGKSQMKAKGAAAGGASKAGAPVAPAGAPATVADIFSEDD